MKTSIAIVCIQMGKSYQLRKIDKDILCTVDKVNKIFIDSLRGRLTTVKPFEGKSFQNSLLITYRGTLLSLTN